MVDLILQLLHFLILIIFEEAVVLHLMTNRIEVFEQLVLLLVDVVAVSPSLKVLDIFLEIVFYKNHFLPIFPLLVGSITDLFDGTLSLSAYLGS